jgi:hypothetical protein
MLADLFFNLGAGPWGYKCAQSIRAIEWQGMIADLTRCKKKVGGTTQVPFPFAPLAVSAHVSCFLLGSCVGAWPHLEAGPMGRPGQPE